MKQRLSLTTALLSILFSCYFCCSADLERPVTIAVLAKDKAPHLPFYLACLEKQTWPASKTYLYIRTNNNNDNTAQILREWVEKVKDRYLGIYFDDTDVAENIQQYEPHEWVYKRFKVLATIRNASIVWAYKKNSHYFVADCDNFIIPETIETMVEANLPIIAPLLHSMNAYSNYHADVNEYGYYEDTPLYLDLLNQKIKGLTPVPVIHCTYFIQYSTLPHVAYKDKSRRHEYVIFSDIARKKEIPQYLDTRKVYGYITFAQTTTDLLAEQPFNSFLEAHYSPQ